MKQLDSVRRCFETEDSGSLSTVRTADPPSPEPGWRWIMTAAASIQIVEYLVQSRNAVQATIGDP
jgi:hypothetical protein